MTLKQFSTKYKNTFLGTLGWLSWLSVCLQLRSCSRGPGIKLHILLPAHWGACFCLCPSSCSWVLSLKQVKPFFLKRVYFTDLNETFYLIIETHRGKFFKCNFYFLFRHKPTPWDNLSFTRVKITEQLYILKGLVKWTLLSNCHPASILQWSSWLLWHLPYYELILWWTHYYLWFASLPKNEEISSL